MAKDTVIKNKIENDILTIGSHVQAFVQNFAKANLEPFKIVNASFNASGNSITADFKAVAGGKSAKMLQKRVMIGLSGLAGFADKVTRQIKLKDVMFITDARQYIRLHNA